MTDKEKGPGGETPEPMGTVENSKRANSIPAQGAGQAETLDAPLRPVVWNGRTYWNFPPGYREAHRCDAARRITTALGGEWYGKCGWLVCPVCQYDKPSLAIGADDYGQLLLSCLGGCSYGELTRTLDRLLLSFKPLIFCMPHGAEAELRRQVEEARAQAYGDEERGNVD